MECPFIKDTGPRRIRKAGLKKQYWNKNKKNPHSKENKNNNKSQK
jgi:hypothetical protein